MSCVFTHNVIMMFVCKCVFTLFLVLCLVIAGVKTHGCSSWAWSQGSGGRWLCFAGSVTGYSVKCGHLSTFPTYTVLGKLKANSENCAIRDVLRVKSYSLLQKSPFTVWSFQGFNTFKDCFARTNKNNEWNKYWKKTKFLLLLWDYFAGFKSETVKTKVLW